MIKLLVKEIKDPIIQEDMKRIQKEFQAQLILRGQWAFFEIAFTAAVTNLKYPHQLAFVPKDIIQTSLIGAGDVIWNYENFDATNLDITVTGVCTVRAFIGSFVKGDFSV